MIVGAIDVGAPRNIGWAILNGKATHHGSDLDEFVQLFASLIQNKPAALGFEAPLFVPRHNILGNLTKQRNGETGRPWSAGAGATVTTIGLTIVDYTMSQLRLRLPNKDATLNWKDWPDNDDLLIWEAFVSTTAHAGANEHWRDALTAVNSFNEAFPELDKHNAVVEENVISLAGMSLLRTGWEIDRLNVLSESCLVLKPQMIMK